METRKKRDDLSPPRLVGIARGSSRDKERDRLVTLTSGETRLNPHQLTERDPYGLAAEVLSDHQGGR